MCRRWWNPMQILLRTLLSYYSFVLIKIFQHKHLSWHCIINVSFISSQRKVTHMCDDALKGNSYKWIGLSLSLLLIHVMWEEEVYVYTNWIDSESRVCFFQWYQNNGKLIWISCISMKPEWRGNIHEVNMLQAIRNQLSSKIGISCKAFLAALPQLSLTAKIDMRHFWVSIVNCIRIKSYERKSQL